MCIYINIIITISTSWKLSKTCNHIETPYSIYYDKVIKEYLLLSYLWCKDKNPLNDFHQMFTGRSCYSSKSF